MSNGETRPPALYHLAKCERFGDVRLRAVSDHARSVRLTYDRVDSLRDGNSWGIITRVLPHHKPLMMHGTQHYNIS